MPIKLPETNQSFLNLIRFTNNVTYFPGDIDLLYLKETMDELAKQLPENINLKALNLSGSPVTYSAPTGDMKYRDVKLIPHIPLENIILIANALTTNHTLLRLTLKNNLITDHAATAFSKAIKENKSLEFLDLSNNKMTDNGALILLNALKYNPDLKINLENNLLSNDMLEYIEKEYKGRVICDAPEQQVNLINVSADEDDSFEKRRVINKEEPIIPVSVTQTLNQLWEYSTWLVTTIRQYVLPDNQNSTITNSPVLSHRNIKPVIPDGNHNKNNHKPASLG